MLSKAHRFSSSHEQTGASKFHAYNRGLVKGPTAPTTEHSLVEEMRNEGLDRPHPRHAARSADLAYEVAGWLNTIVEDLPPPAVTPTLVSPIEVHNVDVLNRLLD